MPLEDAEFEARRLGLERAALAFLRSHPGTAYSAEEVMVELGNVGLFSNLEQMTSILDAWVLRDRATTLEADGTIYYRYDQPFGLRPPRR